MLHIEKNYHSSLQFGKKGKITPTGRSPDSAGCGWLTQYGIQMKMSRSMTGMKQGKQSNINWCV